MTFDLPYSEACERNRKPILDVLRQVLPDKGSLLEIGSCTGQHLVFFAASFPGISWQPSDQAEYLGGLTARISQQGTKNILEPVELNVLQHWPEQFFDAVYSANTAHIMSWDAVCAMFAGVGDALLPGGVFCLYGPFNVDGRFTSASNEAFDLSLRARDAAMGIRDLEALESLAQSNNMVIDRQYQLPANNCLLVFVKNKGN